MSNENDQDVQQTDAKRDDARAGLRDDALTKKPKFTTDDLDAAVADVFRLRADSVVCYFELGQKVREIHDRQLWKLRIGDDGKQAFTSFEAFCRLELKMDSRHAYNAIDAAKNYESAEEIRELGGTSKAVLILKAAPVDRERIKAKVKAGASWRDTAAEVKKSREKHGAPKETQQAKAAATGAKKRAASKAQAENTKTKSVEQIVVSSITGSRSIRLYAKPATVKGMKWPPEKRATKIGDLPFTRLELQPGVVQYISVLQGKGGELQLSVMTVRED